MSPATIEQEQRFERELRDMLVAEIDRRGLSPAEIAEAAGLFRTGVEALLERQRWPLDVAIPIANALGMRIRPDAQRQR